MPYKNPSEAPDNVPEKKKAQWVEVFNSVYAKAIKDKKDPKDAEGEAFKQANGVVKERDWTSAGGPTDLGISPDNGQGSDTDVRFMGTPAPTAGMEANDQMMDLYASGGGMSAAQPDMEAKEPSLAEHKGIIEGAVVSNIFGGKGIVSKVDGNHITVQRLAKDGTFSTNEVWHSSHTSVRGSGPQVEFRW